MSYKRTILNITFHERAFIIKQGATQYGLLVLVLLNYNMKIFHVAAAVQ